MTLLLPPSEVMGNDATAATLLGVKATALATARAANLALPCSPALPATGRYRGVVWQHLDPATLTVRRRRVGVAGLVLSGLLSAFWRPAVTAVLAERCHDHAVFDLLPAEHARAVDLDGLGAAEVIRVEFRTRSGRAVGHAAKAAKGRFARHLLRATNPMAAASAFDWEGWTASIEQARPAVTP